MKDYVVLFGFLRGRRGDVISVPDEHAPALLAAGLIAPAPVAPGPEERAVVTPEAKEGGNVPGPTPGRRQRRAD